MAFDVDAFLQKELSKPTNVGKRSNKHRSGRAARRQYNGQRTLQAVGGTANLMQAIHEDVLKELCVTVRRERGYVGGVYEGTPMRDPSGPEGMGSQGRGV